MSKVGKSIYFGAMVLIIVGMIRSKINVSNMGFFVVMCCSFLAGTFIADMIQSKLTKKESVILNRIWIFLPVISLCAWIVLFFLNETKADLSLNRELLIRNYFPRPLWLSITVIGVALCVFVLNKTTECKESKYKKWLRISIAVLYAVIAAMQFYAPNIFLDERGGTYHSHAYTSPIINVCWLIPYGDHLEALYGHYAILFMPVLKGMHRLFHIDYLTGIFIVCAVLMGITILLFAWIVNYFAKNELIYYLSLFAAGEYYFMLMQGGVYLQVHPHRMIFPVLLVAFALFEYKKHKRYNVVAIGILALSLVWSTEVGLVLMAAFSLYRWVQEVMDGQVFTVKKCLQLVKNLALYALIPFALAYMIVNVYNVLVGGEILDLTAFMYPLISERGYISHIELPLQDVTHAWIGAAILFLVSIGLAMLAILFPEKYKSRELLAYYFLLGIAGLGLMLYYINRPVEGSMFIVLFLMLIMQTIVLQRSQDEYIQWKNDKEKIESKENRFLFLSLRIITVIILFVMAFDSIYSIPGARKAAKETVWRRDELVEFAEEVASRVPENVVCWGEGVPELLSMVDRDTHLHTTEWSYRNTPIDTMEKVRYDLEKEEWFFCNLYSLWIMQEEFPGLTDNYALVDEFQYNNVYFGLYMKVQ